MLVCIWMIYSIVFLVVGYYLQKFFLEFRTLQKLPAPSSSSIIGNTTTLLVTPDKIFKQLRRWGKNYYPIYTVRSLWVIAPCLLSPEDFELVLSNPAHNEKSPLYDLLKNWLKTGLLTSKGKKWATRRRILTPAFHFSILKEFVMIFNEETEKFVRTLQNLCHEPFIAVNQHVTQFALKTIAETAMGTHLKFNSKKEVAYKNSIFEIGQILLYRLIRSWYINNFINFFNPNFLRERRTIKTLHIFTQEVIAEREQNFQKVQLPTEEDEVYTGRRRLAMLDLLLTAKIEDRVIDDEGIREEVDTFMFEGHDTTATALNFALMLLACHRNVQDKIVEEIESVMGDLKKKPTYSDFQNMKYLERAVKEVLRLYPSVHFISRKLGDHLVTSSGYEVPKGTYVHLHIYDLHHNAEIYPDPEQFDPDRFLPENTQNRHPFAYVPFSAGPRNCIGQRFAMLELKAAICGVLGNFILEPIDTPDTIVLVVDIVLRTKDDIRVKFVPRD